SFIFADTNALDVNIAAVDVDGDHDLDLVINGRFTWQKIGVWINDGRGVFTQNFHLYSVPQDRVFHSLRLDLPKQAIDENASRRLPTCLPPSRFNRAALFPIRAECATGLHCTFRPQKGSQHLRAPPTRSTSSF